MPEPKAMIAIAGGTGSGKTSIAQKIEAALPHHVTLLAHDAYYKDHPELPFEERVKLNYDHPDSFDNSLFLEHLALLRQGQSIDRPVYNFSTHSREPETVRVAPREVIIVEGILVLADPELLPLYDLKVFIDTDADVRILRRIERDLHERGRSLQSVVDQYLGTVKPMHEAFVEPSKRHADVIIPEGAFNFAGFDVLLARIRSFLTPEFV